MQLGSAFQQLAASNCLATHLKVPVSNGERNVENPDELLKTRF
ncbi:hypothetical protein ACPOL_1104 [Acidisarcina polymorpha]|uniref:Uncharacterized protein n=1 Tax=Acidisarcina polymorpha TaxID=2211140 RepID=A0A2Z5FVD0_9BACT|nr:hypothetical protein ACPOL_1104 [Acidisarcina polymorpha]